MLPDGEIQSQVLTPFKLVPEGLVSWGNRPGFRAKKKQFYSWGRTKVQGDGRDCFCCEKGRELSCRERRSDGPKEAGPEKP